MKAPRHWPWMAMLAIVGVSLVVGARGPDGPPTADQRVERITSEVRCPTCRGQSVADSDSPAAVSIRQEVRRRVDAGESDAAIKGYLVDRFTDDILLSPKAEGVGLVVWVLPAAGVLAVAGGLAFVFVRRARVARTTGTATVSEADRDLVSRALGGDPTAGAGPRPPGRGKA